MDIERVLALKGGFRAFAKMAWPHSGASGQLLWNWHLDEMCAHYEAVSNGDLKELVVNVPPGTGKSTFTSVLWPAWDAIRRGDRMWMYGSFDLQLSQRDSLYCKSLIASDWYQERWGFKADPKKLEDLGLKPVTVQRKGKQDSATVWHTSAGGRRVSVSVKGKGTGWHAQFQVIDDPTKPRDIQGGGEQARSALKATEEWFDGTMASRRTDPRNFARVLIMQRLHHGDLAKRCIDMGWTHVNIPLKFDPRRAYSTPWGKDPRTEQDQTMHEERFPADAVDKEFKRLGPKHAAAQLQQDPTPDAGGIFKREWFRNRWSVLPALHNWWMSVDCAFKETEDSDYVVIQVWGRKGADFYLIDQIRARIGFVDTVQAVRDMKKKWPKVSHVLVEDKANGSAVINTLVREIPGMLPIEPEGGKEARAHAVSGTCAAGNVWLPAETEWVGPLVEELCQFPSSVNDDQVDAFTQGITHAVGEAGAFDRLRAAMDKVNNR